MGRIEPRGAPGAYRSFSIAAPLATHWRPASCAEVECEQMAGGWLTQADESVELGQRIAHLCRTSGRSFTEHRGYEPLGIAPAITCFVFAPGQECFREHSVRVGRPERFTERDGDFRGNPTGRRVVHVRPDDWLDSFGEHQLRIADIVRRG